MSLSEFDEKAIMPHDEMLTAVLADSRALWNTIISYIVETCGDISEEWKFYSKKAGWSLVVSSGKRKILYLIPQDGFFKVNFVFGEKAVAAVQISDLPESIITALLETKSYMEGRSVMFDVKTGADAQAVKKLIEIKQAN